MKMQLFEFASINRNSCIHYHIEVSDAKDFLGTGPVEPLTTNGARSWIEPIGTLFIRQDIA